MAGALVLLTPVSSGAVSHAPVRMPDLVGRSRLAVYRTMRHDGLYFVTHGPGSANDHWSAVTSQSPQPGVMISWHGEASLNVTNVAPHGPRAVPRLIGLSRAGVYAAMRTAQLYFRTVGPGSSNGKWAVALSQSPPPGTRVAWHAEIVVHVSTQRPAVKKAPAPVTTTTAPASTTGASSTAGTSRSAWLRGTTTCLETVRRGICPRELASPCATSPPESRSPA